jgi:hypothetical protein
MRLFPFVLLFNANLLGGIDGADLLPATGYLAPGVLESLNKAIGH